MPERDTAEGRSRLLAQARPLWEQLPAGALRAQILGALAQAAQMSGDELAQLWGGGSGRGRERPAAARPPAAPGAAPTARRMRQARDPNREAIQQKDAGGVSRWLRDGGLGRFQHVAEQDGFSGFCHAAHAARAVHPVKHHGALCRFVLP
jgi:hypothetical protein